MSRVTVDDPRLVVNIIKTTLDRTHYEPNRSQAAQVILALHDADLKIVPYEPGEKNG